MSGSLTRTTLARSFFVLAFLLTANQNADAQFSWNLTGGGEWLSAGSWTPAGGPPNAVGAVASFGNSITASSTVTITGAATVGEINFTDLTGTKAYTIGSNANTITLNSGTSTATLSASSTITSTGTQVISSSLAVSGGATLAATIDSGSIQVGGAIGGSGGLIKSGAGSLLLSGNNAGLTGGITINGGVLEVNGQDSGPVSGMGANAVTVNAGGQLRVSATGFWQPNNALTISGNGPSGAPQYQDAALWFTGFNPVYYLGPVALNADASLRLDDAFLFRGSSNGLALNGHTARFTGDVGTVGEVDGVISDGTTGVGKVKIDIDGGNIGFDANNTYTGTTIVNRGTLFIDRAASLGQALGTAANAVIVNDSGGFFGPAQLYLNGTNSYTVANKLLTLNGGLLVANGGTKAWTGAINLTADSIIGAEGIAGHLTISGGIDLGNHQLTLRPNFNDSVITIDTVGISGAGSVKVIPVTGIGTINLNVTSTYSGGTIINSHNVYANASQSTGTGAVTIGGGSLRGIGSVTGAVTVNTGSIAPGGPTTTGNLTLNGGVNFAAASQFLVRVNSNTDFDSATVTGTTVLGNAILSVNLSGAGTGFNPGVDKLYILKMASGNSPQSGTTFNVPNDGWVGATSQYNFYAFYDYSPGGGVYLTAFPVPEPGSILALAAGGLGLIGLARRSRR